MPSRAVQSACCWAIDAAISNQSETTLIRSGSVTSDVSPGNTLRGSAMASLQPLAQEVVKKFDGFRVEVDYARERADVILDRPPYNIILMPQREQLRLA